MGQITHESMGSLPRGRVRSGDFVPEKIKIRKKIVILSDFYFFTYFYLIIIYVKSLFLIKNISK